MRGIVSLALAIPAVALAQVQVPADRQVTRAEVQAVGTATTTNCNFFSSVANRIRPEIPSQEDRDAFQRDVADELSAVCRQIGRHVTVLSTPPTFVTRESLWDAIVAPGTGAEPRVGASRNELSSWINDNLPAPEKVEWKRELMINSLQGKAIPRLDQLSLGLDKVRQDSTGTSG